MNRVGKRVSLKQVRCRNCKALLFHVFEGAKPIDFINKGCRRCHLVNKILLFNGKYYYIEELLKHREVLSRFSEEYKKQGLKLPYIDDILNLVKII